MFVQSLTCYSIGKKVSLSQAKRCASPTAATEPCGTGTVQQTHLQYDTGTAPDQRQFRPHNSKAAK